MVSFPLVSPPRPDTPPSPHPYTPYAQPISFFSILLPAQHNLHPLILFVLAKDTGSARDETEFSLVIDKLRAKLTWEQSE